jgi:hypothetical protein
MDERTNIKPMPCPVCGYKLDAATSADLKQPDLRPSPGDLSICFECTSVLIFDLFGGVQLPTPAQSSAAYADRSVERFRAGLKAYQESGEVATRIKATFFEWSVKNEDLPMVMRVLDRSTGLLL